MKPFSNLRVLTNQTMSQEEIEGFLERNRAWIDKRLAEWSRLPPPPRREGRSGEVVYFLGEPLTLKHSVTLLRRSFVARSGTELCYFHAASHKLDFDSGEYLAVTRHYLQQFLEIEAEKILTERARHWENAMRLVPKRLRFANQKARWGSCSSRGTVALNRKLVGAPLNVIDSVIIHEFAHLQHMNHSPEFWDLVRAFVPDLDDCEAWFRDHSHLL